VKFAQYAKVVVDGVAAFDSQEYGDLALARAARTSPAEVASDKFPP